MNLDNYEFADMDKDLDSVKACKPAFGYYGAKQRISKSITEMLPPHNAWVEVFCGSAAITLAKKPSPIEVINDLDNNIINVFSQLRNNHDNLMRVLELTPYSREEFNLAKSVNDNDSDLEKARKFLIICMMTVNATIGSSSCGFSFSNSFARGGVEARVNRWKNLNDRVSQVIDRIKNVRVEKLDAREIVKMFSDRPATLMYLDPPYFVKRSHDYPVDQKEMEFHEELLELCCRSKAMILVSSYDNKLYRKYLNIKSGWRSKTILTSTRDTSGKDFNRKEIVWMNNAFIKAKKNNRVPVRLSIKEKNNRKLNPPRR